MLSRNHISILVSFINAIVVCVLWRLCHWGQMNYHEQLQLFLLTPDFFEKTVWGIGGLADYVSQFLTQFFIYHLVGAIIVALLVSSIQILSFRLIKRVDGGIWGLILSFVPCVASYCVIGIADSQLTSLVALIIGLACADFVVGIKEEKWRYIILVAVCMLVYLLAGTVALLTSMVGVIVVDFSVKRLNIGRAILYAAAITLAWIGMACASHVWGDHAMSAYIHGINYISTPMQASVALYVNVVLLVVAIALANVKLRGTGNKVQLVAASIIIIVGGVKGASCCYDYNLEELFRYDYLCRQNNWDEIIAMAKEKSPQGTSEQNYLNLALAKKGQLTQWGFEFKPKGPESLYVPFERHPMSVIPAGEVFYHLGLTHVARRYFSESQGAIANHYLSVRYTKRLAEIDLINGDWATASKYLRLLQNTMFYGEWAKDMLLQIEKGAEFAPQSEYAEIRSRVIKGSFTAYEDASTNIEQQVKQHPQSRYVWDYLLMHYLFDKRMDLFIKSYTEYVKVFSGEAPQVYQEATLISWMVRYKTLKDFPYYATQYNKERIQTFVSTYNSSPNAEKMLERSFPNTLWYYLFFY